MKKTDQGKAHIFQINLSQGGVPKLAVSRGEITFEGLADDRQSSRDVHGGPERALCLYSLERILALQREGHPIFPGAIGENLTVAGLDWDAVVPGLRLQIGESVMIEVTRYTTPCSSISAAFSEHSQSSGIAEVGSPIARVSQKLFPGWSRLYARVLQPGSICVGDRVQVIGD